MIRHPAVASVTLRPYYLWMAGDRPYADTIAAACLLDLMEQWHNAHGGDNWFKTPLLTLYDALAGFCGQKAVSDGLRLLTALGLIESRRNPDHPMDRTYQYRLNESEVQKRIDCWEVENRLRNAPLRILAAYAQPHELRHDAENGLAEVHMRVSNDSLDSSNSLRSMDVFLDYRTIMRQLIPMLRIEVFPVVGKHPAPKVVTEPDARWEWSKKRLGRPGVQPATFHAWKVATGFGMVAIKGDRLVFLDIDRDTFEREVLAALPRLKETYRQARGTHSCYAFRLPTETGGRWQIADDEGEIASIRDCSSYQVGAGSLHPSGERYTANMLPPIELSEVEAKSLFSLFESKKAKKPAPRIDASAAVPAQRLKVSASVERRFNQWLTKAVDGALGKLQAATKGNFNEVLYDTAFRLSALARYTGDTPAQLTDMLWAICEQAGYVRRDGRGQTSATIRSGLNSGVNGEVTLPKWYTAKVVGA